MKKFDIDGNEFVLNGDPMRMLAGAMHYFRVPQEYWEDRMLKLKAMGLNILETYVCWNLHEPKPGEFDFDGMLDIVKYVELAGSLGFHVIVRPGPYICSEWDMGGLPPWLLKDPAMQVRCSYKPYLHAVDRFSNKLLPMLKPLQISEGGPMIAMQIENEYGCFGNDTGYLLHIESLIKENGIDTLLFTSDNMGGIASGGGELPHILQTANFGSKAENAFAALRKRKPEGPLVCMEFWNGWFDAWGQNHHTRKPEDVAQSLDEILAMGGSVCLYMAHGGTNFGFMSGANGGKRSYAPTITSYDSNAPIDECGDLTPKFWAIRETFSKYVDVPEMPDFEAVTKAAYGTVKMDSSVALRASLDQLSAPIPSPTPVPMEMVDQNYGYILYRTQVNGPFNQAQLDISEIHDRAHIFLDGELLGIRERERKEDNLKLDIPEAGATLEILVENMGRVNYGPGMIDRKGITEYVALGGQVLFDWEIVPLPMDNLDSLEFIENAVAFTEPTFFNGVLDVETPNDTFLKLDSWSKGVVWINGFNLGWYWERGPQQTLYVPGTILKPGVNDIIVLELDSVESPTVEFQNSPELG